MPNGNQIRGHVTTEATGKGLKLQQVLAVLLTVIGIVVTAVGSQEPKVGDQLPATMMTGIYIMAGGMVWFVTAKMLRWWHHG